MDFVSSVLLGLALAAGPAVVALCMFVWLGVKWFEHEARCLNKLLKEILDEKDSERD
jgi:hypothetical protein